MACKCLESVNEQLKPRGVEIGTAIHLSGNRGEVVLLVSVVKRPDAPKRTRIPAMVATYCPFCGVKWFDLPSEDPEMRDSEGKNGPEADSESEIWT